MPKKALKLKYFHNPDKKLTPVSDLLARGPGMLGKLRRGAAEAEHILATTRRHLPPELVDRVFAAILKDGTLTLLVRSAAWGTRLRYQAPRFQEPLAAALGAPVEKVVVKVRAGPG